MDIGFQTSRQNLVDVRYRVLPFREQFSQNFTQKMRGGVYVIDKKIISSVTGGNHELCINFAFPLFFYNMQLILLNMKKL